MQKSDYFALRLGFITMRTEVQSWPYNFPLSEDFPHSDQRGSVSGTLLVDDSYVSNHHILAVGAHIGLAPPGEVGSFQREGKGYQFWTNTNNEGHFLIENIRPGDYNLYAWVPGFIGDFRWEKLITVTPGGSIEAGTLLFKPPRDGPTLWEIGTPDRSAASCTQYIPSSAGTPARDCILLAACEAHETLPQSVEFPADIFTSCLTTPIKIALRW